MATRVMFCGDVHLGRRPAGLPSRLEQDHGLSGRELGPKAALERAVDEACRRSVAAFVFAGDVVDEDNRFFEAYGPLRNAVGRLVREGIGVFGVCGNHDVETLPRLARELPEFCLLGANGEWRDAIIGTGRRPSVALRGWSFPARRVTSSPFLQARPEAPRDASTLLGVLHGDLDVKGSPYAPISRRELEAEIDVRAWFLGHVHKPSLDAKATRPIGYLGSLSGLDRTETGVHGPWLVEVADSGALTLEHIALAPLVWERVVLDASSWNGIADFETELLSVGANLRSRWQANNLTPRAVGISLVIEGTPAHARQLRESLESRDHVDKYVIDQEGICTFVAEIDDRTHERIDLAQRAMSSDPAGLVARRILELEVESSPIARVLVDKARGVLADGARRRLEFVGELETPQWSDVQVRERLTRAAWRALETLESTRQELHA